MTRNYNIFIAKIYDYLLINNFWGFAGLIDSPTSYATLIGGTGSKWGGAGWYLVVLGQYRAVLVYIWWYWVSIGLLCLYVLKKVEIRLDVIIAGRTTKRTNDRTRKDRATQPMDQGRLRWAINHFFRFQFHFQSLWATAFIFTFLVWDQRPRHVELTKRKK